HPAAPKARQAPGDLVIGDYLHPRAAFIRGVEARGDSRPCPALPPAIGPVGLQRRRTLRLVHLLELQLARVRRGRRADLDRERAVVATVLTPAGDRRPGQTRRHALDVDQRLPNPL